MTTTLDSVKKQIESGDDLHSIVRTMKALAATSVRQYEKAAESLDDYLHTVQLGLSVVLSSHTEIRADSILNPHRPILLLIFGSDHGLVGSFNEQITTYALDDYWPEQDHASDPPAVAKIIAAAGEQVATRVAAAGVDPAATFIMPTSIGAIPAFVHLLLERIERWRSRHGVERAMLFFNRPLPRGFSPRAETLLPVSLEKLRQKRLQWQSRALPIFTMPPDRLLSALLRQYFFVSLYRACALSLAAENTSRLVAMQAAEKNIDERLDELKAAFQQQRQAAITG
ncbi:MAG: F0F1 ATP synthase subunit gamma, partial [Thermaerobacterales bacterium]